MRLIAILMQVVVPDPSAPPELAGDTRPDPCMGPLWDSLGRRPDRAGVGPGVGVLGEHCELPERIPCQERHPHRPDRVLHRSVDQHDPLHRSSDLTWTDGVHRRLDRRLLRRSRQSSDHVDIGDDGGDDRRRHQMDP